MEKDRWKKLLAGFTKKELISLRGAINGKLGKTILTPERQAIMQAGRKHNAKVNLG